MGYILAIDAGTTNSRALIINHKGKVIGAEQMPFRHYYPNHGWIEQNGEEIWDTQVEVIHHVLAKHKIDPLEVKAIGITNQRETTLIWDKNTGKPIWHGIAWNDRRTADLADEIRKTHQKLLLEKTGLYTESYFSLTKILWLLDNVEGARKRAENGELLFGTINTWLLWNLTRGKVHATDVSNASRTLLFNIHTLKWDEELLTLFNIPKALLPEVKSCSEIYGETAIDLFPSPIPIASMIGDQQSSLFGHACFDNGEAKCTFGTGSFILVNKGTSSEVSSEGLLTTVAWQIKGEETYYALEGLVYAAGSVIEWLKDSLGLIKKPKEIEGLAYSVPDSGNLYFVPALNGLASPNWNGHAKGTLLGITASTNLGHIARATLEGIAHQVADVIETIKKEVKNLSVIKCGGKMTEDVLFMQITANLLDLSIVRSKEKEMTGLGAAFLAGLAIGFWKNKEEIKSLWKGDQTFTPSLSEKDLKLMRNNWRHAIESTTLWAKESAA